MFKWKGTIEVVIETDKLTDMVESLNLCVQECHRYAEVELVGLVDTETDQPPEPKIVPGDLVLRRGICQ